MYCLIFRNVKNCNIKASVVIRLSMPELVTHKQRRVAEV